MIAGGARWRARCPAGDDLRASTSGVTLARERNVGPVPSGTTVHSESASLAHVPARFGFQVIDTIVGELEGARR